MAEISYTEKQAARKERNEAIVAAYRELRRDNPDASPERIFITIAENYDISSAAIRVICAKSGEYVNRKAKR